MIVFSTIIGTSFKDTFLKLQEMFSNDEIDQTVDTADGKKIVVAEQAIVNMDKFSDMRQGIWESINSTEKIMEFISKTKLEQIVGVLRFVFPDTDVRPIIIDICDELLTNYKDRTTAYSTILHRYKFE